MILDRIEPKDRTVVFRTIEAVDGVPLLRARNDLPAAGNIFACLSFFYLTH